MDFNFTFFVKVVVMVIVHSGALYFIFRQLDKIFGAKR
jgi:hypothetical protein